MKLTLWVLLQYSFQILMTLTENAMTIYLFFSGSSLSRPSLNAQKDKYASLGYIQAKKSGSSVFIKALIDSENLFGDIMSERLAKLLNIKYKPCTNKAGTAVANQKVHVYVGSRRSI